MRTDIVSFLVLDFKREQESRLCLTSIRKHAKIPYQIIYLDNGSNEEYPWALWKEGLIDVLISKKTGRGGGQGQDDLFRYCDTRYAFFVQEDQILIHDITPDILSKFIHELQNGAKCIDLNNDQSASGRWTDRAHFIDVEFFNSLRPLPCGGPGQDAIKWNEQYLQERFDEIGNPIVHVKPLFFADNGKWSVREAGDGLYKHRCDTKQMWIVKRPTYRTEVYPPFNETEWDAALSGKWIDGSIPKAWEQHSFTHWN